VQDGAVTLPTLMAAADLDSLLADEVAFRAWYEATMPRVYGYLHSRCGRNSAVAEDLTSETFVAAVRGLRSFDGRTEPLAWLIGIARHKLADHYRRAEREERATLHLATTDPPTPPGAWDALAMHDALATLPPMQRAALILRYVDDLPVREVARLLGRSEGAIESLLSRGREGLRRALGDEP
jgi:RNA polymerase sigma-70 factor (ECF subfamily)